MPQRYAISDIHGCKQSFMALLDQIALSTADELFLLGDYIDRGPDSKGVIDLIWELQRQGYRIHCLPGNHEQLMLNGRTDPEQLAIWLRNGGLATLASFDCTSIHEIPLPYFEWLESLPYYTQTEGFLLAHAGFDFANGAPFTHTRAMLWIRNWYRHLPPDWPSSRIIVHGHTPQPRHLIEQQRDGLAQFPVIGIDAGCMYTHPGMGQLCAFSLSDHQLYFQSK